MRKIGFILTVISLTIISCGPKPGKSISSITKEIDNYKSKVDANANLQEETIEGALTDTDGFKDIGQFNYTVYSDRNNNDLVKIKNIEITDKTISETNPVLNVLG